MRLYVPVDDLLIVNVRQRLARLARVLHRLVEAQARIAVAREHAVQVDALDELHHQVLAALVGEVVEHLHHARMAQQRKQPRLDVEALRVGGVLHVLDRHRRARARVAGAVHRAHRAARDRRPHHVAVRQREIFGQHEA